MRLRLRSGLGLGYRTSGAGEIIVLLHPIGLSSIFWQPVMERLAGDYRLIAIDLRGHGESDVPGGPFSLEDLAGDAIELIRVLAGGPVVVVGVSMGGMVAQAMALSAPDIVAALVLANTSDTLPPPTRAVVEERSRHALVGMPHVVEATLARWFAPATWREQPQLIEQVRGWLLAADPTVHSWGWRAIRALDYARKVHGIKAPVLIVTGSDDKSASPDISRAMQARFANAVFAEVPQAGHMTAIEQPDAFAARVRAFIAAQK